VVDYETDAGETAPNGLERIDHVVVDRNGSEIPHRADQYVLATGGLVGKGVRSERERVFEPIFDCHVPHAADRYDWFVDDVFGDQPYARFGLPVDRDLRPLDASDEPEFSNLRSAGAVLGGYDFAAEKSGAGVSLATGYVAGRRAARRANDERRRVRLERRNRPTARTRSELADRHERHGRYERNGRRQPTDSGNSMSDAERPTDDPAGDDEFEPIQVFPRPRRWIFGRVRTTATSARPAIRTVPSPR